MKTLESTMYQGTDGGTTLATRDGPVREEARTKRISAEDSRDGTSGAVVED